MDQHENVEEYKKYSTAGHTRGGVIRTSVTAVYCCCCIHDSNGKCRIYMCTALLYDMYEYNTHDIWWYDTSYKVSLAGGCIRPNWSGIGGGIPVVPYNLYITRVLGFFFFSYTNKIKIGTFSVLVVVVLRREGRFSCLPCLSCFGDRSSLFIETRCYCCDDVLGRSQVHIIHPIMCSYLVLLCCTQYKKQYTSSNNFGTPHVFFGFVVIYYMCAYVSYRAAMPYVSLPTTPAVPAFLY